MQTITDGVTSSNSQSFSYDSLQRLSQAVGGYGTFGFAYDANGNRLSQTHGIETTSYGYGTGSDLLGTFSVGGVVTQTLGYTADGRMASLSPGIQAPDGQYITSLGYNQDARLSAVNAAGGALASYTYDGFGQRVAKTISGTTGNLYQYGQDGLLLEEANSSGTAQADYIYLAGRPVAVLNNTTSTLYFLHDDMLGTPQLVTDSSQAVQWQATYQPFGTASVSGTVTQNLRFLGQYFDVESGWSHNGFRNYLPELGRYAEPDPLGRLGSGNNLYAYVYNNPISLSDPTGLATYLILVGQSGLGAHNVGNLFNLAAQTYANQLAANGDTAITLQVSSVQDVASALSSNGYIDGGVTYFGHSGVVPTSDGLISGLFLGEDAGFYTNLTAQNIGMLSGANLGPHASLTLRSCHAGYGNPSIAQSLANQLNRGVYASDTGFYFSNSPTGPYRSQAPSSNLPIYLVPMGSLLPFVPNR
ncbi:MAG: RHS repeat-associated core domain-containing protein [Terracidiphilus sp.]|nr:RHS repeat-associated core domain-containing protein [Terracidiphilus sp.]